RPLQQTCAWIDQTSLSVHSSTSAPESPGGRDRAHLPDLQISLCSGLQLNINQFTGREGGPCPRLPHIVKASLFASSPVRSEMYSCSSRRSLSFHPQKLFSLS